MSQLQAPQIKRNLLLFALKHEPESPPVWVSSTLFPEPLGTQIVDKLLYLGIGALLHGLIGPAPTSNPTEYLAGRNAGGHRLLGSEASSVPGRHRPGAVD